MSNYERRECQQLLSRMSRQRIDENFTKLLVTVNPFLFEAIYREIYSKASESNSISLFVFIKWYTGLVGIY